MRLFRYSILLICLLSFSCCKRAISTFPVLDLSSSLDKPQIHSDEQLRSFKVMSLIPVDDAILSDDNKVFYSDSETLGIYSFDTNTIHFLSRTNGKSITEISHHGRGPGEWLHIYSISCDGRVLYVSDDPNAGKLVMYSKDGTHLADKQLPKESIYYQMDAETFALTFSNNHENAIEFYNSDSLIRSVRFNASQSQKQSGMTIMNTLRYFNSEWTCRPALGDTIYKVTPYSEEVLLVIDKKDKGIPEDCLSSPEALGSAMENHIFTDDCRIVGDFAFIEFGYKQHLYREVWHLPSRSMVFKQVGGEGDDPAKIGLPLNYNGKDIYVWPQFTKGSTFYCVQNLETPMVIAEVCIEN